MSDWTRRQMISALALPAFRPVTESQPSYTVAGETPSDWRNIVSGTEIPRENYSDQPYVVITKDGNWLCVLTTGNGKKGLPLSTLSPLSAVISGKTWSTPVDIEPATGPEASWVMPLAVPSGRVYAFYTYNSENLRLIEKSNSPTYAKRVDTFGSTRLSIRTTMARLVERSDTTYPCASCVSTVKMPMAANFCTSGASASRSLLATVPCLVSPRSASGAIRVEWSRLKAASCSVRTF